MAQRTAVRAIQAEHGMSERRACALVGIGRSTCRYRSRRPTDLALRERLRILATERRRFGYRRLHVLLRREGYRVNLKRVYRLYREEGLAVRRRCRVGSRAGRRWSCRSGSTSAGRWTSCSTPWRTAAACGSLAVVDDFTRACLAIEVDTSIGGRRVVEVLQRLVETRGTPAVLITDNVLSARG